MNIYLKGIFIVTLLVAISSCSQKSRFEQGTVITYDDFESTQSLIGTELVFDEIVLRPTRLQVFDSLLFTINTREDWLIHLFDLKTKRKIGERISAGQGPNEMLQPRIIKVDSGSITIFDMVTSTLFEYALNDFVQNETPTPIRQNKLSKSIVSEVHLLDDKMIGADYNHSHQLLGFDLNGNKVGEYGTYPISDMDFSNSEKLEAYRFSLTTNFTDKMLICYNWTDLIDLLDKDGCLLKRIHGPAHFISSFKEVNQNNAISANSVKGKTRDAYFNPIHVGDDFFILYSGKSVDEEGYNILANQVFAFGWDGTPKQVLTLDQGIFAMAVDGKNKKIYGISNTPEYHLVEFSYN